jgi:hypothetical protein
MLGMAKEIWIWRIFLQPPIAAQWKYIVGVKTLLHFTSDKLLQLLRRNEPLNAIGVGPRVHIQK